MQIHLQPGLWLVEIKDHEHSALRVTDEDFDLERSLWRLVRRLRRANEKADRELAEFVAEDLELHRRVLASDPVAFETLYRRYGPSAYGLALRVTGQPVLAQDVVHEAFMALWRAPEAYDPVRGPFRTFFLSLVHHRAVDAVRREERLRRRTERALNPSALADEDVAEGVVEEAWLAVRRGEVRRALKWAARASHFLSGRNGAPQRATLAVNTPKRKQASRTPNAAARFGCSFKH